MIPLSKPLIGEKEKANVLSVLESGMLAQGPRVKELEQVFAKLCGVARAVAVNSGTAAIHGALYAAGIGPADEVITTPFTFVATANPVLMQGATVVFCDIKEDTLNIDPERVSERITSKTKAIIAVDLYGHPADYKELRSIADKHNLILIEDACQAANAEYYGRKAGSLADIAVFSFYATKNIMCGEGGMITTNNEKFAIRARSFRHHCRDSVNYDYVDLGYNYRMTDIAAAIALAQLERLGEFTEKRISNAKKFNEAFDSVGGIVTPLIMPNVKHVFHQYTIRVSASKRDDLKKYLLDNEVDCAVFYPKPLHLYPHFASFGYKQGDFPVAERASKEVLSLPVHPALSESDIQSVIKIVKHGMAFIEQINTFENGKVNS